MEDGEDHDFKERIQEICLQDGHVARMGQDAQRTPGEFEEDGCSDGPNESQGHEGAGIGAEGEEEITTEHFRPGRRTFLALVELTTQIALHEATRTDTIRSSPVVIDILERESRMDRAAHTH